MDEWSRMNVCWMDGSGMEDELGGVKGGRNDS